MSAFDSYCYTPGALRTQLFPTTVTSLRRFGGQRSMPGFPASASAKGGAASAVVHVRAAREFYAPIIPIVVELRRKGLSLREIASELDRRGIRTRQVSKSRFLGDDRKGGSRWSEQEVIRWRATHVKRILIRARADEL